MRVQGPRSWEPGSESTSVVNRETSVFEDRRMAQLRFLELRWAAVLRGPTAGPEAPEKKSPEQSQRQPALCPLRTRSWWPCAQPPRPRRPLLQGRVRSRRPEGEAGLCLLLIPSPAPPSRHRAAEGLWLACSHLLGLWYHRPPGPADLNSPLCSELPSPAAFSYLNGSLWAFAKEGTKANDLVAVVL